MRCSRPLAAHLDAPGLQGQAVVAVYAVPVHFALKALRSMRAAERFAAMGASKVVGCAGDAAPSRAGPRILNTIKTLINQTPGEVMGLAMPTLWAKLERGAAYEECRQLTGNRLSERVKLAPINRGDLAKFVGRRLPGLNGALAQAVALVEAHAKGRGNLAFARQVCKRAGEIHGADKISIEDFGGVVTEILKTR